MPLSTAPAVMIGPRAPMMETGEFGPGSGAVLPWRTAARTEVTLGAGGDYLDLQALYNDRARRKENLNIRLVGPIRRGLAVWGEDLSGWRIYADPVLYPRATIASFTKTNPIVVTTAAPHGFTSGQVKTLSRPGAGDNRTVVRPTEMCAVTGAITVLSSTTFSIAGVDATNWTGTTMTGSPQVITPVPYDPTFVGIPLTLVDDVSVQSAHGNNIFMVGIRSALPEIDFLLDANLPASPSTAYLTVGGDVMFDYHAGVIRAGLMGLSVQSTRVIGMGSVWALNGGSGVKLEQASAGSTFQGSQFYSNVTRGHDAVTNPGSDWMDAHVSRASHAHFQNSVFNKSQGDFAISVHRAVASLTEVVINDPVADGVKLLAGAIVQHTTGIIRRAGGTGVRLLQSGCSYIGYGTDIVNCAVRAIYFEEGGHADMANGNISGSNGGAGPDVAIGGLASGIVLNLGNCTTSNGPGGNASITDVAGFDSFAVPSYRGIVFGGAGGVMNQTAASNLYTISADAITLPASGALRVFRIDTQGAAAADDLVTINGGFTDQVVILRTANSSRDVTLRDGTGNLRLNGDCTLTVDRDTITLMYNGAVWCEVARSING